MILCFANRLSTSIPIFVTIFLNVPLTVTNFIGNDYKGDIIVLGDESYSTLSNHLTIFQTSKHSNLVLINCTPTSRFDSRLRDILNDEPFHIEAILFSFNISLISSLLTSLEENGVSVHGLKIFFIVDLGNSAFELDKISNEVQEFAQQYLPDLTDVFFGNNDFRRYYGVSCIQRNCITLDSENFRIRRKSLLGALLIFAVIENWVQADTNDSLSSFKNNEESKLTQELITGAQIFLNFTYTHVASDWPFVYENRSWGGSGKLVEDKEVDAAIARTYIFPVRVSSFRFLTVTHSERLRVYFYPVSRSSVDIMTEAFEPKYLLFVSFQVIVGSALYKLITGLYIPESIVTVIGIISQQGTKNRDNISRKTSGIILAFVLNLSSLLVYIIVSAQLVSTFSLGSDIIKSLEDLLGRNYKFLVLKNSYLVVSEDNTTQTERLSTDTTLGGIVSKLSSDNSLSTWDEGVQAVLSHKTSSAFLSEVNLYSLFQTYASNQEYCNQVNDLEIQEAKIMSGAFVRKDSRFAEYLNLAFGRMLQTGLSNLFSRIEQRGECPRGSLTVFRRTEIEMAGLKTTFLILSVGFIASLIFVMLENKVDKFCLPKSII